MTLAALICCVLAQEPKLDLHGDPLPAGALARLGTVRFRGSHYLVPVAVSADGGIVAAFESGGVVIVWDGKTGPPLHHLSPKRRPDVDPDQLNPGIALSADGRRLAAGSYDDAVRVWDTASGKLLHTFDGLGAQVAAVAISPDGKTLAAGTRMPALILRDLDSGQPRALDEAAPAVGGLAFSADGKLLAVGAKREIRVLDPASGRKLRSIPGDLSPEQLVFSADGRRLAFAELDASVRVLDTDTWTETRRFPLKDGGGSSVMFTKTGKLLFPGADGLLFHDFNGTSTGVDHPREGFMGLYACAREADLLAEANGQQVRLRTHGEAGRLLDAPRGHANAVTRVALSPNGRLAASIENENLFLWEAATGRFLKRIDFPSGGLTAVAFSPDGLQIAGGGVNFDLTVWNVETGSARWKSGDSPGGSLACLAWSPDGSALAVGDEGKSGRIFDAAKGAVLADLAGHESAVQGIAWLDARTLVTASSDATARIWNAANGRELGVLRGHTSDLSDVAVSADGSRILTSSIHMNRKRDGTVRVWESFSGDLLRTIVLEKSFPAAVLALSPDGRRIATFTAFQDEIRFWDVLSGRPAGVLPGHRNGGRSLVWSRDGARLLSGGMDTAGLVWAAPPDLPRAAADLDLETAWDGLRSSRGADLERLHEALAAGGAKAVALLLARCRPTEIPADQRARIDAWIKGLESDDVAIRAEAVAGLVDSPWPVETFLRAEAGSPEFRDARAKILADQLSLPPRYFGEALRRRRAIAILEHIGSPEAKAALQELAATVPTAAEALQRLR